MKTKIYKTISYAYPTSIMAEDFGHGKTGCYIVSSYSKEEYPRTISNKVFVLKEKKVLTSNFAKEIAEYADALDGEWDFDRFPIHSTKDYLLFVGFE